MKILKGIGTCAAVIVSLPFALVTLSALLFMTFEAVGACVNHISTDIQANELRYFLSDTIEDIDISDIHSETGNTSGTGNHVDCLTGITFSSELSGSEIETLMSERYGGGFYVAETDGSYYVEPVTSAPFKDNIEGH